MRDAPRPAGATILLVDDEPDHIEMYRFALEEAGFVIAAASTGRAAIDQARARRPDLVVLDVRLPDMSGWDVCAAFKSDARTAGIPVLILTAAAPRRSRSMSNTRVAPATC